MLSHNIILGPHLKKSVSSVYRFCHVKATTKNASVKAHTEKSSASAEAPLGTSGHTISTKYYKKLPQRQPLAKNFFLGQVDTEFLAFPEVITKEELLEMYENVKPIKQYIGHTLDSSSWEQTGEIPKTVLEDLRQLHLYGLDVPQHFGGRGFTATETAYHSAVEANDLNISALLNSHRIVTKIIEEIGTDAQQMKFLPKLASGELIGSVALFENNNPETGELTTVVKHDQDETQLIVNGKKTFVSNGIRANLLVVLTKSTSKNSLGDYEEGTSAILVETDTLNGLTSTTPEASISCRPLGQASIKFTDVVVPPDNILGKINGGEEVLQKLIRVERMQAGQVALTTMTKIIKDMSQYCIDTSLLGKQLMEFEGLRDRFAKAACAAYAVESMTYMTLGLIDGYESQDVDLEAAIIKLYAVENVWKVACTALDFMGPKTLLAGTMTEKHFRDAAFLYTQSEPLDSLRLYIGLAGLQHAGMSLHETVTKVRNPLFNPKFIMGRFMEGRNVENPKMTLNLGHDLHPSLEVAASWLEASIVRLQIGVESALSRHGPQIMLKNVEVLRLTECATLIFAMFASVARASRAYCVGLANADYEMLTASCLCLDGMERVKQLITEVDKGPYATNDMNHQKLAKQLFQQKGLFYAHPLTNNF